MAPTPSTSNLIAKSFSSASETVTHLLPRYYRSRRRLSRGALIGVIVSVVVAAILCLLSSLFFRRRRMQRSHKNLQASMQQTVPGGWTHVSGHNNQQPPPPPPLPANNPFDQHAQNPNGLDNNNGGGWVQPGTYQPPPYEPEPVYRQGGGRNYM